MSMMSLCPGDRVLYVPGKKAGRVACRLSGGRFAVELDGEDVASELHPSELALVPRRRARGVAEVAPGYGGQGHLELIAAPRDVSFGSEDAAAVVEAALAVLAGQMRERGERVSSPEVMGRYMQLQLAASDRELFGVAFLDSRHCLLDFRVMFEGTIDTSEVHVREVVKAALGVNAAAVVVGHNHPSGNPEPSAADRAVTARLKQALALVDVRLLDHFVVGHDARPTSLAARGWI